VHPSKPFMFNSNPFVCCFCCVLDCIMPVAYCSNKGFFLFYCFVIDSVAWVTEINTPQGMLLVCFSINGLKLIKLN
jgi:hypothetical protein